MIYFLIRVLIEECIAERLFGDDDPVVLQDNGIKIELLPGTVRRQLERTMEDIDNIRAKKNLPEGKLKLLSIT